MLIKHGHCKTITRNQLTEGIVFCYPYIFRVEKKKKPKIFVSPNRFSSFPASEGTFTNGILDANQDCYYDETLMSQSAFIKEETMLVTSPFSSQI